MTFLLGPIVVLVFFGALEAVSRLFGMQFKTTRIGSTIGDHGFTIPLKLVSKRCTSIGTLCEVAP